jgi:hypothetical protein
MPCGLFHFFCCRCVSCSSSLPINRLCLVPLI